MSKKNTDIQRQIFMDLKKQIFSGELQRNQRIVETHVAKEYQVNKANVREALIELENIGMLTYIPMKGYFVKGITHNDFLEIAKIREMLESAIFEDFLKVATQEDIDAVLLFTQRKIAFLKANLKEEAHKETVATFARIYTCTSYQRMAALLQQYREYIDLMIKMAFDMPDDIEKTIKNSELLYDVISKRDYELCKKWISIRYQNLVKKVNNISDNNLLR